MRHQLYQASPKAFITATSTTCSAGICSCTFSKQNIHFCQTRSLLSCSKLVADIGICLQLDAQQQHISGAIESKRTRNLIAAIFSLVRSWHCKVLCWQRGSGHRIMHNHTSVMHSHQRWKWLSGKKQGEGEKKGSSIRNIRRLLIWFWTPQVVSFSLRRFLFHSWCRITFRTHSRTNPEQAKGRNKQRYLWTNQISLWNSCLTVPYLPQCSHHAWCKYEYSTRSRMVWHVWYAIPTLYVRHVHVCNTYLDRRP